MKLNSLNFIENIKENKMDGENNMNLNTQMNNLLELDRSIVGVRFIYNEEDFGESKSKKVIHKIPYCVMVKSASKGHCIKIRGENFGCSAAARVLGFEEISEDYISGKDYLSFNIFNDLDAAKRVIDNISIIEDAPYGMELGPIEKLDHDPNIVIIVTKPYNAMRILQGYNYYFGTHNEFKMGGLQAMCAEISSNTYMTNNICMSMMCAGTRYLSHWGRDEMAIGIPFDKFSKVVEGIYNTVDPLERDEDKFRIKSEYENNGMEGPSITMSQNYDTGYYEFGKSGRR